MSTWHLFGPHGDVYLRGVIWGFGLVLTVQFVVLVGVAAVLFDPTRQRVAHLQPSTELTARARAKQRTHSDEKTDASVSGSAKGSEPGSGSGPGQGTDARAYSEKEADEPWPDNIVAYLTGALAPTAGGAEAAPGGADWQQISTSARETTDRASALWMNVVIHRFFLSLRESSLFTNKMCIKLGDRLNAKLANNSFSHVRLHGIDLGDHVPKLHGVRLLKGITDDLSVALEVDLTYQGGASVGIDTTLTAGVNIPVRVFISSLSGKLRIRCPAIGYPDMYSIAFLEDPGVTFKVDSQITVRESELLKGMVNSVLAEIIRRVFLEMWVLPSWRTFFLPLMIPSLEEESARMDEVNNVAKQRQAAANAGKGVGSSIFQLKTRKMAARASSLLANSTVPPPQSNLKLLDCVTMSSVDSFVSTSALSASNTPGNTFPINFVMDATTNSATLDTIEDAIVSSLLGLVRDLASRKASVSGPGAPVETSNGLVETDWKMTKSRPGISVGKCKKTLDGVAMSDIYWAKLSVSCNAETVFAMLSNPEHYRVMEDSFVDSTLLKQYGESRSVRQTKFHLGKLPHKDFTVFDVKKRLPQFSSGSTTYIVAMRSIGAYKDDMNSGSVLDLETPTAVGSDGAEGLGGDEFQDKDEGKMALPRSTEDKMTRASPEPLLSKVRTETSSSGLSSSAPPSPTKVDTVMGTIPESQSFTESPSMDQNEYRSANQSRRTSPERLPSAAPGASVIGGAPLLPPSRFSSLPPSSPPSTVYLQGYLIESNPTDLQSCTVTVISQLSPDLVKVETNFAAVSKLKGFIEEYVNHENALAGGNWTGASNKGKGFGDLKSFVSSTAEYLMQRRKQAGAGISWGTTGGGTLTIAAGQTSILGDSDDDGASSEYEDTTENLAPSSSASIRSRSGADGDSGSIMSRTGSESIKRVREDFISSAAALARNVSKRRSLGFLTRAGVLAAGGIGVPVSEDDDVTGAKMEPFPIGQDPEPEPFRERQIFGKDLVRVEVPFKRTDYADAVEISWEFIMKAEASILFGLMFRPDPKAPDASRSMSLLFPESLHEYGTRQIVPFGSIATSSVPSCRGNLCLSSFTSGTFVFTWDNSNGVKKGTKNLLYRVVFRPFEVPRSMFLSSPIADGHVGEFGFGQSGKGQHCTGMMGEVTIQRKSLYRAFLVYDQSLESFSDNGDSETLTFLTWDFATNGLEIMFGIYHFTSAADATATTTLGAGVMSPPVRAVDLTAAHSHELKMLDLDDISIESDVGSRVEAPVERSLLEKETSSFPPPKPTRGSIDGAAHPDKTPQLQPHSGDREAALHGPPPKPTRKMLNVGSAGPSPVSSPVPTPAVLSTTLPSGEKLSLAARLAAVTNKTDGTGTPPTAQLDTSAYHNITATPILSNQPLYPDSPGSASTPQSTSIPHSRQLSSQLRPNRPVSVPVVALSKVKSIAGSTVSGAVAVPGQGEGAGGNGVYVFVFDNQTSLVLPRVISFRIGLVTTVSVNPTSSSVVTSVVTSPVPVGTLLNVGPSDSRAGTLQHLQHNFDEEVAEAFGGEAHSGFSVAGSSSIAPAEGDRLI
ncbi:hypothetical protein BC830DRAFT_45973 [Chytriomyces sp. MP71]|nr:hypothetical protein BC830DRAFT_45973 [Chytriomyces sp. MP71]